MNIGNEFDFVAFLMNMIKNKIKWKNNIESILVYDKIENIIDAHSNYFSINDDASCINEKGKWNMCWLYAYIKIK